VKSFLDLAKTLALQGSKEGIAHFWLVFLMLLHYRDKTPWS